MILGKQSAAGLALALFVATTLPAHAALFAWKEEAAR